MEVLTLPIQETSTCTTLAVGASFACADLTIFCRIDELGLEVTGRRLERDGAVLACRVVQPDACCRRCGCEGSKRDTVVRRRPTSRWAGGPRRWWSRSGYRCTGCGHVWRQDTTKAAEPRAKLSRRGLRWAL